MHCLPTPPRHFFYLKLSSGKSCLLFPPLLSDYNGSLNNPFFRITSWLMSLPGGVFYSCLLQSLVVSFLLPLVSTLLSDWRRTVSYKFFYTHILSVSTEELVPPRHSRCALSRLRCNRHSLSGRNRDSLTQRLRSSESRDLSRHSASRYVLFEPLAFGNFLSLFDL